MTITLRTTTEVHDSLLSMACAPLETAGVLLAHLVHLPDNNAVLLATELIQVPDDAYEVRTDQSLQITSDGYMHALKTARDCGAVALWVHSHPGNGAIPRASKHDHRVNDQLAQLFIDRTESGQYGYLVVSHDGTAITFTGALRGEIDGHINRMSAVGRRWAFRPAYDSTTASDFNLFDRNIRAFGNQVQQTIADLTVAVVGAGGTGSAVAEQLTRLGVRSLILIDHDDLSASNTTRVYGSTPRDVGRPKVDVLGDHLERIAEGVTTTRLRGSIVGREIAQYLRGADIVFGCTDDNAGRLRLSRLPYYYLTPLIDCGVRLDADEAQTINGIFGRVTTVFPGAACLICRERVDLAQADAETRPVAEQQRLEKEGYAPALPGVEPAVVAFTTMVAATAVAEMLERLVGYGEDPSPTELILYAHDRAVRGNTEPPRPGHYCDPAVIKAGSDRDTYLGLNWAG